MRKSLDSTDEYRNRRKLEEEISEFIDSTLAERAEKLVLFIDELDRCRPEYAIRLLGDIKNLFENERVIIVYSMDSFTFCGVIGVPLWNLTFSRMWNFHVVGSTFSQESANCGVNFISGVTVANVSPAPIRVNVHASHS